MLKMIGAAAIAVVSAASAEAATITVSGFGIGFFGSTVAVAPEATITSFGVDLYFGGAYGPPGSFCAVGVGCAADMDITFVGAVSNLSFDVGGHNPGDFVALSVFGLGNSLLGSVNITGNAVGFDLSGFGTITRLFFDDSSSGAGFGYDNFAFTVAAVPLPAGLPLMVGGIGALVAVSRRKRNAKAVA